MNIRRAITLTAMIACTSMLTAAPAIPATRSAGVGTAQLVEPRPQTSRPTVCTEQYAPVCGRVGETTKTYSNQCFARAAGAEVIAEGPCSGRPIPSPSTK